MVVQASLTGLVKTLVLIIGVMVILRFFGRVMIAKRNLEEERASLKKEKDFVKERNRKLKDFGKVSVSQENPKGDIQDVDYEEIN
jgi:hypothetical protein